jgi:hypothetical protein
LVRQASRFKIDDYGSLFWWKDENGKDCSAMVSFAADTSYFAPSEKQFMQNFRVNDLENLLKKNLMRV